MFFFIMTESVNESGKRYGKLSVVENAESKSGARWLCICTCGRYRIARGVDLRSGRATECLHCANVRKGEGRFGAVGIAPCERDCPSVMSCKALAMVCEPFEKWVSSGGRQMPDPLRYPPTKDRFMRVMGTDK
jgi:hypothetical protein